LATPAVRKLAKEHDIDLKSIDGSGKDGRVLKEDIQAVIESGAEEKAERRSKEGKGAVEKEEGKREPLRSIRRATARRMAKSWAEIPHVTHHEKVEITAMEQVRKDHADTVEAEGGKLTLTPFLIKALAAGLREHPRFNARLDMEQEEIVYQDALNIGVALDTERGLMVPVIREVDRKSVIDLALELGELADKLRENNRASRDLLRGGTFTLTNVGALGGTGFSPIINHPEVAIFGAARARLEQIVEGTIDMPTSRTSLMLPVCVAFDHRVNDGADAARFMNTVKRLLEDPDELLIRN
jgi:pyruvate dehydrogenase E2 component (dihydrolipoamide acetyltransferase)